MYKTKKTLAILGSTGSIGTQTLSIVSKKPDFFDVFLLSADKNHKLLYAQSKKFKPKHIVINTKVGYSFLKKELANKETSVSLGLRELCELVKCDEIDVVLTAVVGSAGLLPTIAAISAKKNIALANKETLVVAGELIMRLARKNGVKILPVDSEHSAILQCIVGEKTKNISKLILTASGGPFLNLDKKRFNTISIKDALNHPNWSMGKKITIDSATLMNKGFELIEARWLFGISEENIDIIIHPESIIHSLVEFVDGSIKAQLGVPSMTIPILYALTFPKRMPFSSEKLNLTDYNSLSFLKPDFIRFPHLKLAYDCLGAGGTASCALNGANEIAVNAFLNGQISFLNMFNVIEKSVEKSIFVSKPSLQDYLNVDNDVRKIATQLIFKK